MSDQNPRRAAHQGRRAVPPAEAPASAASPSPSFTPATPAHAAPETWQSAARAVDPTPNRAVPETWQPAARAADPTPSHAVPSRAVPGGGTEGQSPWSPKPSATLDVAPTTPEGHRNTASDNHSSPSERARHLRTSLLLTFLSALIPGMGLIGTPQHRLRILGAFTTLSALGSTGFLAYTAYTTPDALIKTVSNQAFLALATPALASLGLAWVALILVTHLVTRPPGMHTGRRLIGALTVTALAFAVASPTALAARYTRDAYLLLSKVLPSRDDVIATNRPTLTGQDPWANIPRVNLLLLGADGDAGREEEVKLFSVRTDTIMVASIDTATGNTVLIQIPRNLQYTPFPAGSEMALAFPNGFRGEPADDWFINSIWPKVELDYPNLMAGSTYRGAEALKLGVEGVTGLKMDYFLMLNIDGLQQLIDAMGGVTVNVSQRLPIGGDSTTRRATGGWIEAGPNQHLDGYTGLWYARSRWSTDDFDRMRRQSCLVKAIVDQANPATLLTRFEGIAAASANMVKTDIPTEDANAMVDLALRVQKGTVTRLVFTQGENGYDYADPDFLAMRSAVVEAINPSEPATTEPVAPSTTETSSVPTTTRPTSQAPQPSVAASTPSSSHSSASAEPDGAQNVGEACAYIGP